MLVTGEPVGELRCIVNWLQQPVMFKQLSQIGKNLSDEFAKGVSEDLHPSQDNHPDYNSDLSPDIVSKLKKFEKYEDKYPKLLAAYKGERSKLERAAEIEKVLTEYTPISSFDDAESLAAFFKDMNEKQNLLNNEIKRLLTESSSRDQDAQQERGEQSNVNELSNREQYEAEINKLKEEISESEKKHSTALRELEGKLESATKDLENLKNERDILNKNYEENTSKLQKEVNALKNDLQRSEDGEAITKLKEENELLRNKINESEHGLHEKESAIEELYGEVQQNREKIESLEKNTSLPSSNEPSTSNVEHSQATPPSKGNAKKKKKYNKKKSNSNANGAVEEALCVNGSEEENLETRYKEVCAKLETTKDSLNADWQGRYDALKAELKASVNSKDEFKGKLEKLEKEYKNLEEELGKSNDVIKEKQFEIEETKDMMKTIGNELVEAKDKLKEVSGVDKEDMIHLENELRETRSELSSLSAKSTEKETELNSTLLTTNKELDSLKSSSSSNDKRRKQLELLSEKMNEELNKLKSENSTLSAQVREYENLKKTHASLKTTMMQKEKTIVYLEQQVKTYSDNIDTTKKTTEGIKRENKQLLEYVDNLKKDYQILKDDSKRKNESLERYIKESGQLSERLSMLQDKYETLQGLKSNSNEQIDSIKRQCEELTVKLKEANKRSISLEDEVTEYSNTIREKTREINGMKRHLSESSNGETAKERELREKLTYEADEKIKLQSEITLQATRKSRDIQDWKQANAELKSELHRLQLREKELGADIATLRSLNSNLQDHSGSSKEDSNELERLTMSLKESLSKADQKIRELQEINETLMHTNDDVNQKLNRLSKNYKALSKQLSELKETSRNESRTSRASSIASGGENQQMDSRSRQSSFSSNRNILPPETISEMNDKVVYIKNVLLGFLEHKDQRNQLLPVVSTLLRFDSNDEKRLVMSLK